MTITIKSSSLTNEIDCVLVLAVEHPKRCKNKSVINKAPLYISNEKRSTIIKIVQINSGIVIVLLFRRNFQRNDGNLKILAENIIHLIPKRKSQ